MEYSLAYLRGDIKSVIGFSVISGANSRPRSAQIVVLVFLILPGTGSNEVLRLCTKMCTYAGLATRVEISR